ncbi:formate dehydrogenase accessory sulfurtransferase FdhD [Egibacter rhizosphaerae]|uniref:Sulfur carrier protein FdhD n=1 Tax=Egibacter rhizosphaerae TaxID=1670831 RepID=A0A411YKC4_9ACTN|nr:formate dehydrogenase accessory sulfurtransferase FdhD [Egibacter rhizosphaerae]QBI21630.1 formate dehydrogenase accessory sulfurtransferase FdhD [Egibacter rhizosphaerae]
MGERVTARRPVVRIDDGRVSRTRDTLAAEEPMEMRVDGEAVSVTMRTPGDDFALALGFCASEGLVADPRDVAQIRYCAGTDPETGENTFNVVDLSTHSGRAVPPELRRHVFTTSSCGICGTASLEVVRKRLEPVVDDPLQIPAETLTTLPGTLREAQAVFERTGGLHAAALFTAEGELLTLREDVGRHNAVDKVIGTIALEGRLPASGHVLMVSGRIAFEIVQKALWARIPAIAAVSAPTSLAVDLAADAGMTLVGFLRDPRMNVYTGAERVLDHDGAPLVQPAAI